MTTDARNAPTKFHRELASRILGGDTVIGKGARVGANAWITDSVPPGRRVGGG